MRFTILLFLLLVSDLCFAQAGVTLVNGNPNNISSLSFPDNRADSWVVIDTSNMIKYTWNGVDFSPDLSVNDSTLTVDYFEGSLVKDSDNFVEILNPNGGNYRSTAADTGYIKIKLPNSIGHNTEFRIHCSAYQDLDSRSFNFQLFGRTQLFGGGGSISRVVANSVKITGDKNSDFTIRTGNNGDGILILIGESNSIWQELNFKINSVTVFQPDNVVDIRSRWNVDVSTTTPSYLPNATTYVDNLGAASNASNFEAKSIADDSDLGVNTILNPDGGRFNGNPTETGAIELKLPSASNGTMFKIFVDSYNYTNESGVFSLEITGLGGGTNLATAAIETAVFNSTSPDADYTVRFNNDGGQSYIYIGETNTVWSYPDIVVAKVQISHTGAEKTEWREGWEVDVVDAFKGTTVVTIQDNLPAASKSKTNYLTKTGDDLSYSAGNFGINVTNATEDFECIGTALVNSTFFGDEIIQIKGNSDADSLEYQGTKLSIGQLNTQSKSAAAMALLNVGGFSDNTELVRIRSNNNTSYFQIIQKTASKIIMNVVQEATNVFRVSEQGNTIVGGEIQCGTDALANLNTRATITQAGKNQALAVFMGGGFDEAIEFSSEGKNYFSASTTNNNKRVELGEYDVNNPIVTEIKDDINFYRGLKRYANLSEDVYGNVFGGSGNYLMEVIDAKRVAINSQTDTHIHIEYDALVVPQNQQNFIEIKGMFAGFFIDGLIEVNFETGNLTAIGKGNLPNSFTVSAYENSNNLLTIKLSITGASLEKTLFPIKTIAGFEANGSSESCPNVNDVVYNTGTDI